MRESFSKCRPCCFRKKFQVVHFPLFNVPVFFTEWVRTVRLTIYPITKRESQDLNPQQFDFKTVGSFLCTTSQCVILNGYRDDPKKELIWGIPGHLDYLGFPWHIQWFPGDAYFLVKDDLHSTPCANKPNPKFHCPCSFFSCLFFPAPAPLFERYQVIGCWSCTLLSRSHPDGRPSLPFPRHLLTAWGPGDREPRSLCKRNQGTSLGWLDCPGHTDLGAHWIHVRFFLL